jgi:vancomycin permeability regulator SanA
MKKVISRTFLALLIAGLIYASVIVNFGHFDKIENVDVCVVLGNKVNTDGSLSKRLKSRLDKSIELYKLNYFKKIIVSGGLGKEGFNEAIVMKKYLKENGIDEDCIIEDKFGINTFKTASFTSSYCKENGLNSIMIVSQYYHLLRTRDIMRKLGVKHICYAHANYYELGDLYSISREMVGIAVYMFRY